MTSVERDLSSCALHFGKLNGTNSLVGRPLLHPAFAAAIGVTAARFERRYHMECDKMKTNMDYSVLFFAALTSFV